MLLGFSQGACLALEFTARNARHYGGVAGLSGGLIGPDLSNIGAERSLRQLRDALTVRRPNIPAGFQPVHIRTRSGETIDGVVKNENNFSMQVMDRDYKLHMLERDDLAKVDYGAASLMPSDYNEKLTPQELQDILAYLSRQVRQ